MAYRDEHRQSRFSDFVNLVQALLDGQGIALVGPPIVQQFYDNGMLIPAIDVPAVSPQGLLSGVAHPLAGVCRDPEVHGLGRRRDRARTRSGRQSSMQT